MDGTVRIGLAQMSGAQEHAGRQARSLLLRLWLALLGVLLAGPLAAAPNFPNLSGRIVDQANIIAADARTAITQKLADLESKSGIQLVVATVTSLDGEEIEPYANELFRTWKLGEKARNNGVLFLIAPTQRKVRIEVGYGLEGTLTDALSKVIVANAVAPRFKTGDFTGGITRGVDDIITVLTTDASEWQKRPALRLDGQQRVDPMMWLVLGGFVAFMMAFIVWPGFRWFVLDVLMNASINSPSPRRGGGGGFSGGGSWGGGGSSGGGFSGGGGSSGGGGASGSW